MDQDYRVIETDSLPPKTLVAPFRFARELRLMLKGTTLNIQSGTDENIYVSKDLSKSFDMWLQHQMLRSQK